MTRLLRRMAAAAVVLLLGAALAPPASADRICVTAVVSETDPDQTATVCVPLPPVP